jgi:predicted dehydrogenase
MLINEDLDLVDVSTGGSDRGGDHYAPVIAALEAGHPVLCEKPISDEIEHAREMVAQAAEKGLCFGVNLNYRFSPACRKAKQWIDEGRLGEINFINKAQWIGSTGPTEWYHMRALHPHSMDIMRLLCGEVKQVHSYMKRREGNICWTNASINMMFESGAVGHLNGSYDMTRIHPMERTEVAGTAGRIVFENVFENLWFYPHDSEEVTHIHNSIFSDLTCFADTFRVRIHRFVEQLANGDSPDAIEGSGYDGLRAQEVIEAAIKSHQTGGPVDLPS